MAETPVPEYQISRRQTRTYDVRSDNIAVIVDAVRASLSPTGSLQPTLAETAPEDGGWLLCDGSEAAKEDYPTLYALLGATYGETETHFTLPDLRGRLTMGIGANGAPALAALGGAQDMTLTIAQLPAHGHAITDPGHTHTFTGDPHSHGVTDPGHSHGATQASGADSAAGTDTTSATAGSTDSATTGVSVNSATATGTNAAATTGISVQDTGGGESFDIVPPVIGVNWLIRT